ncbi:fibrinogen alpha chain [Neosynchiropus ocellatus]
MGRCYILVFLGLICVTSTLAVLLDPRGSRPVVPNTRSEKCATQKEWPFCTDDDWWSKCPSGCRIQGLMDMNDHNFMKRVERIRSLLEQHRLSHRSADQVSKQTYNFLREKLTVEADGDTNYLGLAQSLRQRITSMKLHIDRQLKILAALKDKVKDQVDDMRKLEVDIDIKLRSCKGSCRSYPHYSMEHEGYVTLDKQVDQLQSQTTQTFESLGTMYVMKSRPLQGLPVDPLLKSKIPTAGQLKEDVFLDVKTMHLVLETEGTKSSPATVSKVPGTSYSSSTPPPSSGSSSSSKSITELGGGTHDFGTGGDFRTHSHGSTTTVSCTRNIKRTVIQTPSGPEEKVEEVIEGGPECQIFDFTKGSPVITETSSSSHTTKTLSHSSTKGTVIDDSFGAHMGLDLGKFMTDAADDDIPDVHARSVKSVHIKRQADYVGKDCVDAFQNHLKGETNGVFKIKPGGPDSTHVVEAYCDQEGLMGGWLLVQQRESGTLNFNRTWAEYRDGFGSVSPQGKGEVWLGNQNLHLLTSRGESLLKVELEDLNGGKTTAEYIVRVGPEEEGFQLSVSGYSGDAGDALGSGDSPHNGMRFSTFDRDNDKSEENCAGIYRGGWWYNNCLVANVNGIYHLTDKSIPNKRVCWMNCHQPDSNLIAVRMYIRPATF